MPEFDPYHLWLGIPPAEQPPNHYRLLGVPLWEPDPRVIEAAADRQMGHLRNYQTGQHAAESQQLLNEVAAARVCLLNAEKRAAYDAALLEATGEAAGDVAAEDWAGPAAAIPAAATRRRPSSVRPLLTVAGILLCGFAGLGVTYAVLRGAKDDAPAPMANAVPTKEATKSTKVEQADEKAGPANKAVPLLSGIDARRQDDGLTRGWFRLVNRNSRLAIGVRGGSKEPKTDVIQWNTPPSVPDSHWRFVPAGKCFLIQNRNSGLFLFVADSSPNPGVGIWQMGNAKVEPSGRWIVEKIDGGFFKITSERTGFALSISMAAKGAGNAACMWPFSPQALEQHWQFEPIPGGE